MCAVKNPSKTSIESLALIADSRYYERNGVVKFQEHFDQFSSNYITARFPLDNLRFPLKSKALYCVLGERIFELSFLWERDIDNLHLNFDKWLFDRFNITPKIKEDIINVWSLCTKIPLLKFTSHSLDDIIKYGKEMSLLVKKILSPKGLQGVWKGGKNEIEWVEKVMRESGMNSQFVIHCLNWDPLSVCLKSLTGLLFPLWEFIDIFEEIPYPSILPNINNINFINCSFSPLLSTTITTITTNPHEKHKRTFSDYESSTIFPSLQPASLPNDKIRILRKRNKTT